MRAVHFLAKIISSCLKQFASVSGPYQDDFHFTVSSLSRPALVERGLVGRPREQSRELTTYGNSMFILQLFKHNYYSQ